PPFRVQRCGRMDAGPRGRLIPDHRHPDRGPDGGQVVHGGRRAAAVRVRLRHEDVAPPDEVMTVPHALDLDGQGGCPLQGQDERGRLGERRQERPPEGDHLVSDANHARVREESGRYPGPGAVTSSPARIRIASIASKRSAASRAITFEIPGSKPMDTSAVRPTALKSSALASCAKIPGWAPGSEGPAAAMSRQCPPPSKAAPPI